LYKYNCIFVTNVSRLLAEREMTKKDLATLSGVSPSFLSDLLAGKGNPSLQVMEAIAEALEVPLPLLLEQNFPILGHECIAEGRAPYNHIFVTNVSRLMVRREMTKKKLVALSGVSPAFLTDIMAGKGNPSLRVMEDIAKALEVPLPSLLKECVADDGVCYSHVFVTNVSRLLAKRGMTKKDLSTLSGVSPSFLSEILAWKKSPSLQVSEDIAKALEVPLPLLLDRDFPPDFASIPEGKCIAAMLPPQQASVVKKWAKTAQSKLQKPRKS